MTRLRGQPTKLTKEIGDAIAQTVSESLSIKFAAELHDVPRSTVCTWLSRGISDEEQGIDSVFTIFSAQIKKARAKYVQDAIKDIRAGISQWQGTAWLLERCCAEDFGRDSELYKKLLEDYKMLMQSLVDQNKGVTHGS